MRRPVLVLLALSMGPVFGGPIDISRNANYGHLPLAFEANRGQADPQLRFIAHAADSSVFITRDMAVLDLHRGSQFSAVSLRLEGIRPSSELRSEGPLDTRSNYYRGSDPSKWITDVPNFSAIRIVGAHAGVDLVYHGNAGRFEYDLQLAPGADASQLRMHFEGMEALSVDEQGDLLIHTAAGDLRQHAPVAWQEIAGQRRAVTVRQVLDAKAHDILIQVGDYNRNHALTIDPIVTYSTYLGGSGGDQITGIAVDSTGNAYVTGSTYSNNFPVTSGSFGGQEDAFIAKINPEGTALVYATYVGGSGADGANAIAVDNSGNAYITGWTYSANFPVIFSGSSSYISALDTFVTELSPSGTIASSRYLDGGSSTGTGIAVDSGGNPYVTGHTQSTTFPTTAGSLMTTKPSASSVASGFVAKMDSSLNVSYGTYLGGSGTDNPAAIAVDSTGQAYVVGSTASTNFPTTVGAYQTAYGGGTDAFVLQLNAQGASLIYSTYLGGANADQANAIALDATGNAYVAGLAGSTNFPTTSGAFLTVKPAQSASGNLFVTKVNAGGATLGYSTFLGGNNYNADLSTGIAVDSSGDAFVTGATYSTNFPTTPGSLFSQPVAGFYGQQMFLTEFNPSGSTVLYSTYFGVNYGSLYGGIALDRSGGAYIVGTTNTQILSTTPGALQTSSLGGSNITGFVAKLDFSSPMTCDISLSSPSINLPGRGGTGLFTFTLAAGCPWEITTSGQISVTSSLRGFGNGTVDYTAPQNQSTYSGQTATVTVNGGIASPGANVFTVNQAAGSCTDPVFSTSSVNFDGTGGLDAVGVTLPSGCPWSLSGAPSWLTLTSSSNSTGTGTLSVYAPPYFYSTRAGTINVAGKPISVMQTGGACTLSLSSSQITVPAQITASAVSFTTGGTCTWNAYTSTPWIQIVSSSASGQGNGSVSFVVAGNPGSASRSGSLLIGDQTFAITQAGGPAVVPTSYTEITYSSGYSGSNLGDGGPVSVASFFAIYGMNFDQLGNLYVADSLDNRIRRVDTNGIVSTFAGGGTSGLGDEGPATSATLYQPQGVAVDASETVYISDSGHNRIRKVSGGIISTIAGTGSAGFSGDNQPAASALINFPTGIVVDQAGNIYFSDTDNNRIRKITPSGIISTIAGGSSAGYSGDGGPATSALLHNPTSLALDASGNLYVMDLYNYRVRKISTSGIITTVAGNGIASSNTGDGGPAVSAAIFMEGGLAVDGSGSIFIGGWNGVVREVTPDGNIRTISSTSDGYSIGGLAINSSGDVFAGDWVSIHELIPGQSFCGFSVAPPTPQTASGGTLSVAITGIGSCSWSATSNASWLTPVGSTGTGSGAATFTVAANTGVTSRAGSIVVAGQTLNVVQSPAGLQFYPVTPCRVADTRTTQNKTGAFGPPALVANTQRDFPILSSGCGIPANAEGYSLNFTVVPSQSLQWLAAWPAGQPYPRVSTLNDSAGALIANAAIVPAGTNGSITVIASDPTDLIIDIDGYFAPPSGSGLDFFPMRPCRVADTRASQGKTGAFGPPSLSPYSQRDFPVASSSCNPPGSAQAYSLNMTVLPKGSLEFLSTWPSGESYPGVSTLNSPTGAWLANAAIVPAGNGGVITVASDPTDLLIDINGTFGPSASGGLKFYPAAPCRVADTRSTQPFTGVFGSPSLSPYAQRNFPIASSNCAIPSDALAYALNITAVPSGPLSFLSIWPVGQPYPSVSTLNAMNGQITANAAIVPAGTGGAITVVAGNPTDVIIDAVGYFAP